MPSLDGQYDCSYRLLLDISERELQAKNILSALLQRLKPTTLVKLKRHNARGPSDHLVQALPQLYQCPAAQVDEPVPACPGEKSQREAGGQCQWDLLDRAELGVPHHG